MLKKITDKKRQTIAETKLLKPLQRVKAEVTIGNFAFSQALKRTEWSLIAECKLASPAKGTLCSKYSVPELATIFTENGATALSVHTDVHFRGRVEDIKTVRAVTGLPILRKDFIIDEYQLYEARVIGADAVLLIANILSDAQLQEYLAIANELGLDSLVEVHTLEELERVQKTPAALIGINNRNLKTFVTDVQNTFDLLPYCDKERLFISESGVSTADEAYRLKAAGVRGILVGEGLVKVTDIASKVRELVIPGSGLKQINGGENYAK